MLRKYGSSLIKLGITAVALTAVLSKVDIRQIWANFTQAQLIWVFLAFALVNASMVVRAYRWHLLLVASGSPVQFGRLVELYFAAGFYNSILPSGLAGDVVRIVEVAQDVPAETAAGTVVVDRATGLITLFALALLALPFRPPYFPQTLLIQIVLVCVVGLVGGLVVLEGRLVRRMGRGLPRRLRPLWRPFDKMMAGVEACGWRAVWAAMGVSVLFNLMQIGWWWSAGKAFGFNIPIAYYFITTPLMALATLLPSVGGLGIREYLATLMFVPAGITAEQSVTLSLLVFTIERISGLLGAPIYIVAIIRQNRAKSHQKPGVQE